jgi:hypothetical protein
MADLPVPNDYALALGATTPSHSADHNNIRNKVDTAAEDITATSVDVATLQGQMTTAQADINLVEADVATAQGDITDLDVAKVPVGGTTAQVLAKTSAADYAMAWSTVGAGGGPVTAVDVSVDDALWQETATTAQEALDEFEARITSGQADLDIAEGSIVTLQGQMAAVEDLPAGGTTGQALVKTSNADYDVAFDDVGGAPTGAYYLLGSANGSLPNGIVAGTSPAGELGGSWGTPLVDASHGNAGGAAGAYHTQYKWVATTDAGDTRTSTTYVDLDAGLTSDSLVAGATYAINAVIMGNNSGASDAGVSIVAHLSAGTGGWIGAAATGWGNQNSAAKTVSSAMTAYDTEIQIDSSDQKFFTLGSYGIMNITIGGILVVGDASATVALRYKNLNVSVAWRLYRGSFLALQRIA